jgi:hypothetical protein
MAIAGLKVIAKILALRFDRHCCGQATSRMLKLIWQGRCVMYCFAFGYFFSGGTASSGDSRNESLRKTLSARIE